MNVPPAPGPLPLLRPRHVPSPAARFARALAILVFVLGACYLAATGLTGKVRDLTPQELQARMSQAGAPGVGLDQVLPVERAIQQVNRLRVEERREVMRSPAAREYVQRLTPEQRAQFVRGTLDRGVRDQLERFHRMPPSERAAFIAEVRAGQKKIRDEWEGLPADKKARLREFANSDNIQELIEQATKAYLSLTTSAERAELQPLFEGALENLEYARGLK